MKTHLKMLFVAVLCLGWCNYSKAQLIQNGREIDTTFNTKMNFVFGNLDKSHVPFGILKDYALEFTNLKSYDGSVVADSTLLNKALFYEIYNTLVSARVTSAAYTTMPNPAIVDSIWYSKRQSGTVALCGLFYQYGYLDANALNNGKITVSSTQYFDKFTGGIYQNPYLTGKTVGFAPATETYMGQSFNILLSDDLWLSNSKNIVSHIDVDAGDGLGYRTIAPNVSLPVTYADTGVKIWNFKLFLTDGTILQSHTRLQVNADVYGQNTVPDTTDVLANHRLHTNGVISGNPRGSSNFFFVTSSETFQGTPGKGYITLRRAPGHGSIQKPLIVVEGFDPGKYTNPETLTGYSSLQEFDKSVINTGRLAALIQDKTTAQYDIIFVDYADGTDDIHHNALVVKEVIRWVNSVKQPLAGNTTTEKNVVLGQSMGGVVARYALKSMENGGESHDTRLFISDDGVQQGANVPFGYQFMINHASDLYARTGVGQALYEIVRFFTGAGPNTVGGIVNLGQTPAAKQMLINHVDLSDNLDNGTHIAWQNELTSFGYPSQGGIRNVAISNGSECGQGQIVQPGGSLTTINGNFKTGLIGDLLGTIGFPIAAIATGQPALLVGVLPGSTTINMNFQVNAANANGGNLAYHGNISLTKKLFWIANITVNLTDRSRNAHTVLSYDTFGGGVFSEDNFALSTPSSILFSYGITVNNANGYCGVPTPSALDLGRSSNALTATDYLQPYGAANAPLSPKNTPFANFITARNPATGAPNNETHISFESKIGNIGSRNGDWLTDELNGVPSVVDCSLSCSNRSISGPDGFCGSSVVQYSIAGIPANAAVSWSVAGSIFISGPATGSTINVGTTTGFGATGDGFITATLQNSCSPTPITLQKHVITGVQPLPAIDGPDEICILNRGNHYTIDAPAATGFPTWTMSPGPPDFHQFTGPQLDLRTSFTGTYTLIATVPTACGNAQQSMTITVDPCLPEPSFVAFPNPAGSTMTITSSGKTSSNASLSAADVASSKTPFTYKVYDDKGKVWSEGASEKGDDINVDVRGLPNKTYFLHITVGKKTIVKQIIVQH